MTFELSNTDVETWTSTQFWDIDPLANANAICEILLYVNWEEKTATVETKMKTNSIQGEVYHGLATEFRIPWDADFSKFQKFYEEKIRPALQELETHYLVAWDGSNGRGYFPITAREFVCAVDDALLDVPTHNYLYAFSLEEDFGDADVVDYLALFDIDLITADLDNEETLSKIRDIIFLGMSRKYYRDELKEIQERL